jgi:hypothetical protein
MVTSQTNSAEGDESADASWLPWVFYGLWSVVLAVISKGLSVAWQHALPYFLHFVRNNSRTTVALLTAGFVAPFVVAIAAFFVANEEQICAKCVRDVLVATPMLAGAAPACATVHDVKR